MTKSSSDDVLARIEAELREVRRLLGSAGQHLQAMAVTQKEAARLLSCSARHVSRMIRRGELSLRDVGGAKRIPVSEIDALLEGPTIRSASAAPAAPKMNGAAALKRLGELRQKRR